MKKTNVNVLFAIAEILLDYNVNECLTDTQVRDLFACQSWMAINEKEDFALVITKKAANIVTNLWNFDSINEVKAIYLVKMHEDALICDILRIK